ncbi:hypothetical protein AB0I89_22005 [Micromonospora sp. NPDC049801]|uniref:hypothetical protein n=1 Tax=unclassified Micromonospora TaxID=2617518 RepID=UPI0033C69B7B
MNDFIDPGPRRARWVVIACGALATLVAATGLIVWVLKPHRGDATTAMPGALAPTATGSSTSVPSGPVQLGAGSQMVQGIAVGHPHSPAGAVTAGTEYLTQVLSNLDPDRARTIATVIADPSFADASDYLAEGAMNLRRTLGVSTIGPVPLGASLTFGPAAYQLRDATPDTTTVLVLGYLSTTAPGRQVASTIGVYPIRLHWAATDWKVLPPDPADATDYTSLAAPPGSVEAAARGWQEITS